MGNVQFYNDGSGNKVLFSGGAVAMSADCCCVEENVPFGTCPDCCDDIPDDIRIYASCWVSGSPRYIESDAHRVTGYPCYFVGEFSADPYCEPPDIHWCRSGRIELGLPMCLPGSSFYSETQCIYPISDLTFSTSPPTYDAIVSVGPATGEDPIC